MIPDTWDIAHKSKSLIVFASWDWSPCILLDCKSPDKLTWVPPDSMMAAICHKSDLQIFVELLQELKSDDIPGL